MSSSIPAQDDFLLQKILGTTMGESINQYSQGMETPCVAEFGRQPYRKLYVWRLEA